MSKHAGIVRFTYNWGLATWSNLDPRNSLTIM
ncbi:MAG: helix-turn-helix domain-containing protein [Microcoleus sp. PH2017_33_LGB_O_A]|nr:helix-turn-helix domain-containing protein [Microcoleus sp. PH2017_33_LGB_O_A]